VKAGPEKSWSRKPSDPPRAEPASQAALPEGHHRPDVDVQKPDLYPDRRW
jgi:hypothetical protein